MGDRRPSRAVAAFRDFGVALCLAAALSIALVRASQAQPAPSAPGAAPHRIGYLTPAALSAGGVEPFRRELVRLGYAEGRDFILEYRSAEGRFDRLPALAADLVALRVDVIVSVVTEATIAAKRATGSIPIVMVAVGDPVGSGLVASLARPGGNVTGTSGRAVDVVGKQVELVRETLPAATRVAALWNPGNAVFQRQQVAQAQAAAARLGMRLHLIEARTASDLERAFATIAAQRPQALLVLSDPAYITLAGRIAALAFGLRVPTFSGASVFADAGALLTYGANYAERQQRVAWYVDRILNGAKPAELAVDQTSHFELVINAGTARALGIAIPQALAVRADRVIE